jgi:hypothetical protein
MAFFTNGKVTTTAIFNSAGVPRNFTGFGRLTTINYEMLRIIARHNKQNKRPIFSFIL